MNLAVILDRLDEICHQLQLARRPHPATRSQIHQFKPLTPEAIALGKKPYLGSGRKR